MLLSCQRLGLEQLLIVTPPIFDFFVFFWCNVSHCGLLYKEQQQPYNPSDPTTQKYLFLLQNHAAKLLSRAHISRFIPEWAKNPFIKSTLIRPFKCCFKYIICMQQPVITHCYVTTSVTNKLSSTCSAHENLKKSRWLSTSAFPFAFLTFYLFCLLLIQNVLFFAACISRCCHSK